MRLFYTLSDYPPASRDRVRQVRSARTARLLAEHGPDINLPDLCCGRSRSHPSGAAWRARRSMRPPVESASGLLAPQCYVDHFRWSRRTVRNSFGPFNSLRLRLSRSSEVAELSARWSMVSLARLAALSCFSSREETRERLADWPFVAPPSFSQR
jgi:hypothetical protein